MPACLVMPASAQAARHHTWDAWACSGFVIVTDNMRSTYELPHRLLPFPFPHFGIQDVVKDFAYALRIAPGAVKVPRLPTLACVASAAEGRTVGATQAGMSLGNDWMRGQMSMPEVASSEFENLVRPGGERRTQRGSLRTPMFREEFRHFLHGSKMRLMVPSFVALAAGVTIGVGYISNAVIGLLLLLGAWYSVDRYLLATRLGREVAQPLTRERMQWWRRRLAVHMAMQGLVCVGADRKLTHLPR